jgi:hypothetical protein
MTLLGTVRQKLICCFLLGSIIPAIAIAFLIYYQASKEGRKQILNELNELSILLEEDVNRFLACGKKVALLLASDRYVKNEIELFLKEEPLRDVVQQKIGSYLNFRRNLYEGTVSITIRFWMQRVS